MKHYRLLFVSFFLVALLGMLHSVASYFYWYWTLPWFDNLAHFLGGLSLGFFFLWVWFASGMFGKATPSKREAFAASLIFVIVVGIGWEFFEYVYGLSGPSAGQTFGQDTFCDICSDVVGGSIAGLIGRTRSFYE
jgi:hypothetical protein